MLKVMTILGTRPEVIKMSRVIAELDRCFAHVLVHSGQNYDYELNQVFFDDLEVRKPDHFLGVAGGSVAQTVAAVIEKADKVFELEQPDALMLYGDTNTCLAIIPAKRRKIPVFHMEAGNRCFDQRVPEELNRKVVDHLSDINMVLTEHARRYLVAEGVKPETVIKTGSHMDEVLAYYARKIESSDILERQGLQAGEYFVVSMHREENVDDPEKLTQILCALDTLAREYELPVVVSVHPRTRARMDALARPVDAERIRFMKPFGFLDYIKLQMFARCILSDSGTITEEAALLNLPAITVRQAHERPEGMDEGTLIMSDLTADRVLDAVRIVVAQHERERRVVQPVLDYQAPAVSVKVARIVASYTDYINRTVWRKPLE